MISQSMQQCVAPSPSARLKTQTTRTSRLLASSRGPRRGSVSTNDVLTRQRTVRVTANDQPRVPPLACPVALQPLDKAGYCAQTGLVYSPEDRIWNLTLGTSSKDGSGVNDIRQLVRQALPTELRGFLPESDTLGTSTFELPSVAFAYERGWRQGFARAGFPGPDAEFELAQKALLPRAAGGVLVDASCGSGLFTRRFANSREYRHVVALDFSESMLRQAKQFFLDESVPLDDVTFVRADIARLPFPEESLDGLHAGAAIHCWPNPPAAIAEISRVLKPGSTFCGTTFLNPQIPGLSKDQQQLASSLIRDVVGRRGFQYWDVGALEDLFASCGLVDFQCDIRRNFIFYSVRKPESFTKAPEPRSAATVVTPMPPVEKEVDLPTDV
eukprot:CAMPEP_0197851900 /NCGR_PEP_ID=MMETSP1438-20131217/19179_1 /TAXON_ID=1461541 /ORGANISM="Pterosperma sp., Strain CCMP1384" /LENGTH=384 /DNA_ID=CAMNT_0043465689 /DNA_START=143 /DNA_END=1297 /DNA_ORIENTATION=-